MKGGISPTLYPTFVLAARLVIKWTQARLRGEKIFFLICAERGLRNGTKGSGQSGQLLYFLEKTYKFVRN